MKDIYVGLGFDVHVFTKKKKKIVLAGVEINCGFGLRAVSDGDVVLHAICDSFLGAAGLGDIGDYFPPRDKKSKGIKSREIAEYVLAKIKKKFKIVNLDITIISQKPPLVKHKKKMVKALNGIFRSKNINIKIKSKEGLNILGGKNALSCICIALLKSR